MDGDREDIMGTTSVSVGPRGRAKGITDIAYFIGDRASYYLDGTEAPAERHPRRVLAHSGNREAFYMAVEVMADGDFAPKGTVFAEVIAKSYARVVGGTEFFYKEMAESMRPLEITTTQKVLDALTPTTNEHALAWRAQVAEKLARPVAKVGDTIRLSEPVEFMDGSTRDVFTVGASRSLLLDPVTRQGFRFFDWRNRRYTIVTPA